MLIELNVKNDKLICNKEYIIAGCKNYYNLKAVFSNDWDGLDKFLTIVGYSPPIAFDENNIVTLPPFSKGEVNIAVLGKKNDDIIAATGYHKFYVQEGAVEDYNFPPSPDDPATWATYIGDIARDEIAKIQDVYSGKLCGFTWYVDTDNVIDKTGKSYGSLTDCMTDDFGGTWFYVRTTSSEAGSAAYPSKYTIDGANGYINLRDYVIWTGKRLVHISAFEAKASELKNPDGKYSPKSGVDGLMSSTDKAYLTDLINEYWSKKKLNVFVNPTDLNPDWTDGLLVNWCRDDGIYLGGFKKDCGGHPPVLNDNHTSWVLIVFNGMATDAETLNRNHRLQIAFDLVNSKIYMRRGWMSSNEWADWSEVGEKADEIANPDNSTDAKDYADSLYNETWKNEPVLTIEIAEECAAIDVTEIDDAPFAFERIGGYAEIVTNTNQEGRLCILLNRTTGQSYNGLVCMNATSSANAGNIQKGIFEVKKEFGMWHTEDIATNTNSWLDLSSTKHEHWDSRGVFGSVDTITSFRLIPYTGVFNAGTVIEIYGKRAKEATAI